MFGYIKQYKMILRKFYPYIIIFVLAFFPRVLQPVSSPIQWYWRPLQFYHAILTNNLANTFQSGHPGVTVMWISGFTETAYRKLTGFPESLYPMDQLPSYPIPSGAILSGIIPLIILISFGVCFSYFLLTKLINNKLAFIAAIFIALDPYYLYQSKVLHLDATLANLMMLSALSYLVFLKEKKRQYLIISAILGGLAILTKTPAVFLVPFIGLSSLVFNWENLRIGLKSRNLFSTVFKTLLPVLNWVFLAGFIFFLLFPALWVSPITTLRKYFNLGVTVPALTPHEFPNYFLGKSALLEILGFKFYLFTAFIYNTPAAVIFPLVSIFYLVRKKFSKSSAKIIILFFSYCLFFLVMMSIAAKKGNRYLTPFFPIFSVISASGFYIFLEDIIKYFGKSQLKIKLIYAGAVFILMLNFVPVLMKHPYYGTYFNPLTGGNKVADFVFSIGDQSEGVAEALSYIGEISEVKNIKIGCDMPIYACTQHTSAKIVSIDDETADYLVFFRNKVVRGGNKEIWDKYKDKNPDKVIYFDDIPYVWVYKAL